jgi:hypothetical protein
VAPGKLVNKAKPWADTDNQVAYAVAYIVSESPQSGPMLLVGSDDKARIYLNEKEIYRQLDQEAGTRIGMRCPASILRPG